MWRTMALQDEAGTPNRTFYFLEGQIRGVFSFRGYPRHGPFSRLAPPKGKSCDRPWDSMVCNDVLLPRSIEVNMGMSMNAWQNKTFIWFGFPWDNLMDCLRISRLFQSMEWTGSIRWIHNPVQSRRIWIGLDQKFTNSADSGLDWIQKCAMCIPYLDLRQFLLIVTLTSEVPPSNLQLFTSSFVFT